MVFASFELVRRIEQAECQMVGDLAAAVRRHHPEADVWLDEIGGGIAAYGGPSSPLTKVAGLGMHGAVDAAGWDLVEAGFRSRQSPVQVELASLADPAVGAFLTGRGYALIGFENVLGLHLGERGGRPPPAGIEVAACGPGDLETWMDVVLTGFATPDDSGTASHESFPREVLERVLRDTVGVPGFERFLARIDGVPVGAASLRVHDGLVQLAGAATLPEWRRRGVQTALFEARLRGVQGRGCEFAIVTTQPGSKSAANANRQGFEVLYTRAILLREGL